MAAGGNAPSFLGVVFDCETLLSFLSARAAAARPDGAVVSATSVVNSLVVFLHSYALLHRENRLMVFAHGLSGMHTIYPDLSSAGAKDVIDCVPWLSDMAPLISSRLAIAIDAEKSVLTAPSSSSSPATKRGLASVLSTALSIVRQQKTLAPMQARLLVLQFDKDRSQNYNAVMNCVFSAQKMEVAIDSLICSSFESHLLQQVSFLTEGQYLRHGDAADLLLVLQSYFLADKATRVLFSSPSQKLVDFKASCHCHQKPVEFALMCSVCLTLMCAEALQSCDRCPVCETPMRSPVR